VTEAKVLIHPAAGLPAAHDADDQGWLPPLWLWPVDDRGCWEGRHGYPEYFFAMGRCASLAEAQVMFIDMLFASGFDFHRAWVQAGNAPLPSAPPPDVA
jgi:hypothetical protein